MMTRSSLSPNTLADLYDLLSIMLEALPVETHPAWELAVESVLFGGEGIAPEAVPYGEQQSENNEFKMTVYRAQYGDGERVTEFPTLPTRPPSGQDRQYVDREIQLPVSPESGTVLPLFVDDDTLPEAIGLLNEFPTEPSEENSESSNSNLLNLHFISDFTASTSGQTTTDDRQDTEQSPTQQADISPNELADLYDGLYTLLESLPHNTDPRWQEAIESILSGGAYLDSEVNPYGKQQAERNEFSMQRYRSKYGDGDRVTEFPAIASKQPAGDDAQYVDDGIELPIVPNTQTVLPLTPTKGSLLDAARLLAQFPVTPDAETTRQGTDTNTLFDIDAFLHDVGHSAQSDGKNTSTDSQSELATDSTETASSNLESYSTTSSAESDLSRQEQERLQDLIDLAPTSNGELASSWGMDTTKEAWKFLSEHLDDYYHRNENSRIEPTKEGTQIGNQICAQGSLTNSQSGCVPDSDEDDSFSRRGTETRSEQTQSTTTSETESEINKTKSVSNTGRNTRNEESQSASTTEDKLGAHDDYTESSSADSTSLRQESAGESTMSSNQRHGSSDRSRKYDDPQAERAHRQAQQRDPSDVVELGEEIKLTIKEVDYTSRPPTVMGTKNRLVVFVIDAPQDLSEYETIEATVVDYGGKNNSAEAVFSDYVNR